MDQRSCSTPGCAKPHRAQGLCSTHYNQANAKPITVTCDACERSFTKTNQWARARYRSACSNECRAFLQFGTRSCAVPPAHPSRSTPVPPDHPSRVALSCPIPATHPCRLPAGRCGWCEAESSRMRYCSIECRRRAKVARRKGREADGHTYSWAHVMRVLLLLDGRCAYCDELIVGPPDPDHVVPLSRRGSNGNGNILPSCRLCNSDKRDLLLHEWAVDRARLGKRPVRTVFDRSLPAFAHLLPDALASAHAA